MATVRIGGRDLDAKPASTGFYVRTLEIDAKIKQGLTIHGFVMLMIDLIMETVGHNEGVTRQWLQDNVSFPPEKEFAAVLVAAGIMSEGGGKSSGEAPAQ